MSNLPKIRDEDREDKYGYVYAVSGPGKQRINFLCMMNCLISDNLMNKIAYYSGHCRENVRISYVRVGTSGLF